MLMQILSRTPIWVFPLLALLLWQGSRALRDQTLPLWRVMIVPLVFLLIGLARLALGRTETWETLAIWAAAAVAFAPIGVITRPQVLAVDRPAGRVTLKGTPFTLIRNVTVFALQYVAAVIAAISRDSSPALSLFVFAVSGGCAGYFAGWCLALLNRYRRNSPQLAEGAVSSEQRTGARRLLSAAIGLVVACLSGIGIVALLLGVLLAAPVTRPPELPSVIATARAADRSGLPDLERYQARDGTWLAMRRYEPSMTRRPGIVILIHGSSGSSVAMHGVGKAFAERGVEAYALDMRGHGASGTRGDIGYAGQLDDDMADFVTFLRKTRPNDPITLIGHSSGGGFALRIAASPLQNLFAKTILLAPYLGYDAPTSRPAAGGWASPDIPRILALRLMESLRMSCCDGLTALAFAVPPRSEAFVTGTYSYRLMRNFATNDAAADLASAKAPLAIIAGAADELMFAEHYKDVRANRPIPVTLLAGVSHMGVVMDPAAIAAVVDATLAEVPS